MLSFLPGPIKGALAFLLIVLNTVFWCFFLFTMAFLKFIIPLPGWRRLCGKILNAIATAWIGCNNLNLRLTNRIEWEVSGIAGLDPQDWYLVVSNHQSWSDILVLQKVMNRQVPFLKFFLKKELIWVPILGLAWWALDYPFMKRYSKEFLAKHPELKGQDLETTRVACQKFADIPVSVMNFVEGTRFTPAKHQNQNSPYTHLLKPKAAGIAYVLAAMGPQLKSILNVTIAYPGRSTQSSTLRLRPEGRLSTGGAKTIWQFLCGDAPKVVVRVESIPITSELQGNYFDDENFRDRFQNWLNNLWAEKDREMDSMMGTR